MRPLKREKSEAVEQIADRGGLPVETESGEKKFDTSNMNKGANA